MKERLPLAFLIKGAPFFRRPGIIFLTCIFALAIAAPAGFGLQSPDAMHHHEMPMPPEGEAQGHEAHRHEAMSGTNGSIDAGDVGVTERVGEKIDLGLSFVDEGGREVVLSQFIDRPTLILPIFYHCPDACSTMLGNLATSVDRIPLTAGEDFRLIAFSFNYEETPDDARRAREHYSKMLLANFPLHDWKFLTGSYENITAFTESIGFRFVRRGPHDFAHPNVLLTVASDGTIVRYLRGVKWHPFDMGVSLAEASSGAPLLSFRRLLAFSFRYEPERNIYTFRVVRFLIIGIVPVLGAALIVLMRRRV